MHVTTVSSSKLSAVNEQVLHTLLYYDMFNYPLKKQEILRFLGIGRADEHALNNELQQLKNEGLIYQFGELFSLQNNEFNVIRRLKGNEAAEKYLTVAKRQAKLIARFPFVRAVMASGSLSKGYMDEKSDLDFFVVTEPGGLWIARTLLVLYKRLFLFNSHKHFCVNYFVDSKHLKIEERNLFTATELATLVPLYGAEYYEYILDSNDWLRKFFPNYYHNEIGDVPHFKNNWFKQNLEKLIVFLSGDKLNSFFMNVSLSRWKRMYEKDYHPADFNIAFKTKQHTSKNHPNHYQQKIYDLYCRKLAGFKVRLDAKWYE